MNKVRNLIRKYKFLVNAFVLLIGIFLLFIAYTDDIENDNIKYDIMLGIGCSIIATSAITLFLLALLNDANENEEENELHKWGITHIHKERQSISLSDNQLPTNNLDFIAFGLQHFRNANTYSAIEEQIKQGLKIRIITLDPRSKFVAEHQRLENGDGLKDDIEHLITWCKEINKNISEENKKIKIKHYNSLPLNFYCKADNRIFVGPYIPGKKSGNVITYEFKAKKKGGKYYADIFESLWKGKNFHFTTMDDPYLVGNQKACVENTLKHFCNELTFSVKSEEEPIGVVVIFKGEKRRTIFSCNKKREEQYACHPIDRGAVGHLIKLNANPKEKTTILFEDFSNNITFTLNHTDATKTLRRESLTGTKLDDDNTLKAVLAIPILKNDQPIGAITFDFFHLPEHYINDIEKMNALELDKDFDINDDLIIEKWFQLAETCRDIIYPMLGVEIDIQYKELYEQEWPK